MQVQLNTSTMHLDEMPLDIGYASEKVTLQDYKGEEYILGGQNGKTQLIITLPFIDETIKKELEAINNELPYGGEHEVTASLVVANNSHEEIALEKINSYIDTKEELGDFYGVRLVGEPCSGELTKSLILISKDGAIFYDEFSTNLHNPFNIETLMRKIYAAQTCYTGKGCH